MKRRIIADHLQAIAMIAVLACGFWQGVAAISTPAARRQIAATLHVAPLLAGQTAAAVNNIMAHQLPAANLWRTLGGELRWRMFGSGGPQVWVGTQGWLYLTEELQPWPDAEANMNRHAALVRAVADRLRSQGITLIITLVPDKARIQQATLGDAPRAAQTRARYAMFDAALRVQGSNFVALDALFAKASADGPIYYRIDTHWNQRGAALAAAAIAHAAQLPPTTAYRTETDAAWSDGPGDLLRLMSMQTIGDRWAPLLRPTPDRQQLQRTIPITPPPDDGDLLDDAPVVSTILIGSSFSLNANFGGALQAALHAPVANFARLGGGFAGSARDYFTSLAFRETPPRLVIWEIPERVVGQPLDDADDALAAWSRAAKP